MGESVSCLIYTPFSVRMKSGSEAWSLLCYFLVSLVSESYLPTFKRVKRLSFFLRPECEPHGQMFLVFCFRRVLVEFLFSTYSQLIVSQKHKLGENAPKAPVLLPVLSQSAQGLVACSAWRPDGCSLLFSIHSPLL